MRAFIVPIIFWAIFFIVISSVSPKDANLGSEKDSRTSKASDRGDDEISPVPSAAEFILNFTAFFPVPLPLTDILSSSTTIHLSINVIARCFNSDRNLHASVCNSLKIFALSWIRDEPPSFSSFSVCVADSKIVSTSLIRRAAFTIGDSSPSFSTSLVGRNENCAEGERRNADDWFPWSWLSLPVPLTTRLLVAKLEKDNFSTSSRRVFAWAHCCKNCIWCCICGISSIDTMSSSSSEGFWPLSKSDSMPSMMLFWPLFSSSLNVCSPSRISSSSFSKADNFPRNSSSIWSL